jgi:hypothetical protein
MDKKKTTNEPRKKNTFGLSERHVTKNEGGQYTVRTSVQHKHRLSPVVDHSSFDCV